VEPYEVRYGPTVGSVVSLAGTLALTVACSLAGLPPALRVVGVVLFGSISLVMAVVMVRRQVAFRVDSAGITVAGSPLRYQAGLLHVPWNEVRAIVLWKQHTAANNPHVGVQRYEGGPPRQVGRVQRRILRAAVPHVPAEVVECSRPIIGWRLDRDRLASAVAHFAPHVEIVDAG